MSVLEVRDVVKRYSKVTAVDRVSFRVPEGTVFGLLGPNGAGKTSIIRMITGITRPDEGQIFVKGQAVGTSTVREVGYMPEERGLYKKMRVGEHLLYLARLKGLSKAEATERITYWFERFDIGSWSERRIEELSKGMQQKVQFIATVVHDPTLIILDEPFSGLDPINANLIKDEIDGLAARGKQILFSTHRMEQVEEICDHIVLVNQGRNVLEGEVEAIRRSFSEHRYAVQVDGELPAELLAEFEVVSSDPAAGRYQLRLPETSDQYKVLHALLSGGYRVREFRELLPSLNEVFIRQVNTQTDTPVPTDHLPKGL